MKNLSYFGAVLIEFEAKTVKKLRQSFNILYTKISIV
jgi:hypothetical protein